MTLELNGQPLRTGLLTPESRPTTHRAYADSARMLTKEEIAAIVNDPARTPMRQRFGPDWIYNQGNIGSCNGCAGAKALQRARVLRGLPLELLSGEGLYAQINGGRDVGSMLDDGMRAMEKNGVPLESLVPRQEYRANRISREAWDSAKRFKAVECYRVDTEDELASGLALGFVGVVAVHASQRFMKLDGNGTVLESHGMGNHAVGVDDVRFGRNWKPEFDMFNSWGTSYGDQGRGWLTWDRHFRQTIDNHAFYLIRTTNDDPADAGPLG